MSAADAPYNAKHCHEIPNRYIGSTASSVQSETAILFQKCHPYTGNPNRETSGDSTNAFLDWGHVLGP